MIWRAPRPPCSVTPLGWGNGRVSACRTAADVQRLGDGTLHGRPKHHCDWNKNPPGKERQHPDSKDRHPRREPSLPLYHRTRLGSPGTGMIKNTHLRLGTNSIAVHRSTWYVKKGSYATTNFIKIVPIMILAKPRFKPLCLN